VQLEVARSDDLTLTEECFNSILVQLEGLARHARRGVLWRFNSILVQLEGAYALDVGWNRTGFNSILVQLEARRSQRR